MSCSLDCVEFMEKCYEEQEQEEQSYEEPEIYRMPGYEEQEEESEEEEDEMLVDCEEMKMMFNMITVVLKKDENTVSEAKQHRIFYQSAVQDLLKMKPFIIMLKSIMTLESQGAKEELLYEIKYMFSSVEVLNASVLISKPFPIDGGYTGALRRWLSQRRHIQDFMMATKLERALNLIVEAVRFLLLIPKLQKSKEEKNHTECEIINSKITQLLEVSRINILPLLINSELAEMFNHDITRIERNEKYKDIKKSLDGYHEALDVLEDNLSEGDYLEASKTLMRSFRDQKTFVEMFQDDSVGNIVGWECSGIKLDFTNQEWTISLEQ